MKKTAIDININPMHDKNLDITSHEVEQMLHHLVTQEEDLKHKVKKYLDEHTTPMQLMFSSSAELNQILTPLAEGMASELSTFIKSLGYVLTLLWSKKDLSKKYMEECSEINSTYIVAQHNVKLSLVKGMANTRIPMALASRLKDIWDTSKDKEYKLTIEGFRLHITAPKLTKKRLDKAVEDIKSITAIVKSSKVPHFASALYGEMFIADGEALGNIAAHYNISSDTISINEASLDKNVEYVTHSLIHELGHRYFRKVLNDTERADWENFYQTIQVQKTNAKPKLGDSIFFDWGVYDPEAIPGQDIITDLDFDEMGFDLYVYKAKKGTHTISIHQLLKVGAFPTVYASTNSEEFFCETISLYHTGKMRSSAKAMVEKGFINRFVMPYQEVKVQATDALDEILNHQQVFKFKTLAEVSLSSRFISQAQKTFLTDFLDNLTKYDPKHKEWAVPKKDIQTLQNIVDKIEVDEEKAKKEEYLLKLHEESKLSQGHNSYLPSNRGKKLSLQDKLNFIIEEGSPYQSRWAKTLLGETDVSEEDIELIDNAYEELTE